MSGIPPQLDTTPGTPSQEWARSTTTAAFSRAEPAPALAPGAIPPSASNPSTTQTGPGLAPGSVAPTTGGVSLSSASDANKGAFDPEMVPGAYPVTPGDQDPTRQTSLKEVTSTAAEQATNIAGQASNLVSSAAQTAAQYLPQGVVDTVSSMMPTSSATSTMNTARASEHDAEHKTSFPSSEVTGSSTGERVGGVGSLPGFVNESAVPKLPHERTDEERYTTAGGAAATASGVAATVAGGAYALKDKVVGSAPSTEQAKQTAQGAAETVQSTAQSAAQTVQGTAQSAAQTAKQTLPGSHSTTVTASTLPSHEPFGAQPGDHSLGVGSLPGTQSEANVALLPEESAHPQFDSGAIDTRGQVGLKPSEETKGNDASFGAARNVAGVGALVGDRSEEGVARLPDERSQGASGFAPVGAVVGSRDDQGKQSVKPTTTTDKAPAPPAKDSPAKDTTKQEVHPSGHKGLPNKGPGYDTDYHPAAIHPRDEHYKEPEDHAAEGEKSLGATQSDANRAPEDQHPPHSGDAPAPTQKKEKASFMEKMKGEAKVLIGKIEGKHEKVEQGQRLKSGEAKAAHA